MQRVWFLHHLCAKYLRSSISLGASKSTWDVAPLLIDAQKVFTSSHNLKCISNSAFSSPPFFVIHLHQFTGNRIDAGIENFPRSPRNAISFWSNSTSPLMAKSLLTQCTTLMASDFSTTHPTMIDSIVMRMAPCSTNA